MTPGISTHSSIEFHEPTTASADLEIVSTAEKILNHQLTVSYGDYRQARYEALQACRTAVLFLGDLVGRQPTCYSPAFRIFEALVLHMMEELAGPDLTEATFDSCCSVLQCYLYLFAVHARGQLSTIREPFYYYVEALARRDRNLRELISTVNEISCHGKTLTFSQPRDQRFLYDQLLNITEEEQPSSRPRPSVPSTNPTCGVCWDQVAVDVFIQGKLMPECEHEANVCRSCLAQSITAQLDSKLWNQLTCPLCTIKIDGNVVERFAPSHTILR